MEEVMSQVSLDAIMKQLANALTKANSLISTYQNRMDSLSSAEQSINEREDSLKERLSNFSNRESAVSKVENVLQIAKNIEQSSKDIQAKTSQLKSDREAFEAYKQGEMSRLNNLRITTQRESDMLVEQKKDVGVEVERRVREILANMNIKR